MNHPKSVVVIVGAGQAGSELAVALRLGQYSGRILLVGDEAYCPYHRPPLSKNFLSGDAAPESLYLKPRAIYEKYSVECLTGTQVTNIDRAAHTVTLSDRRTIEYTKLALTTGGRARRLDLARSYDNLHYIRTIDDILPLRASVSPGRRMVIIGGGYIGLEVASVAIKKGLQVTVIEALPRVLARVTAPELSAFYEQVHRSHGVDVRTGVGVQSFEGDGRVTAVVLADGTVVPADIVIVGIGQIPNTELAQQAGLEVTNGIVVDRYAQTSDPDIVAAGDCTYHENCFLGRYVRLESVPNATEQARIAAANICGKPQPYSAVPWFWSDQYNLKLQMVGLSQGYDRLVIRGDLARQAFCAFYLQDNVVLAVDAVNRLQEFMVAKRLVAERIVVDAGRLADETVPLKSFVANTT